MLKEDIEYIKEENYIEDRCCSENFSIPGSEEKIHWELTCLMCPEQYDIYYKGQKIAYLRERHDYMSLCVPDYNGEEIWNKDGSCLKHYADEINECILKHYKI